VKVGDLVKCNNPSYYHTLRTTGARVGVIVDRTRLGTPLLNKSFRVLWRDGTIGNNVWDYDLKLVNES